MSTMTADIDLNSEDGWVEIVTGVKFIAVQMKSAGRISAWCVKAGDADPTETETGITLARGIQGVESTFSAGGLPDGFKLFLKAETGIEQISVIAY